MSVASNSPLSSANSNAAFVSRTVNTSMTGTLDNQNTTDASSSTTGAVKTAGGLGIAKKLYVGTDANVGGNLTVVGNLEVLGTTSTINSTNTVVEDNNIVLNSGGTDLSADGAGLTIERTGVDGSLVYQDALASKFKAGALGSEVEIANISSSQTFSNKSIDASTNTISNITESSLSALAAIPYWRKYTKTYSDLSFAGPSNDIELFSLPAKGYIEEIVISHSASFTGGTISAYKISIGITGNLNELTSEFDVFQSPSASTGLASKTLGIYSKSSATSIRISAVSAGDFLDGASAGSVDVWVKYSILP